MGLGTALSLIGDATLYTVLPTHTGETGIALGSVGVILGVNRAIRILLNGPAGLVYDRWPRRRLFVPALFLGALSTALYALAQGFWPLLAGRLLWGLSWSLIWVGGTTIILDIASDQDRGRLMGQYQTWFFLGTALGAAAGGVLTDLTGYTMTMWISSALTGLGAVIAWIFLPETAQMRFSPRAEAKQADRPAPADRPVPGETESGAAQGRRLDPRNGLWVAASIYGVNRFVTAGVLSATLGLLVQQQMGAADLVLGLASLTGALMAVRTVLSMLAALASGKASDRSGNRWMLANWSLLAGAAGMALLVWDLPTALLAGVSLGAVASGGLQTISSILPGDLVAPQQHGAAVGLLHTVGDLGSAIGPPVAFALLPGIGLSGVYLLCAGLFLAQMVPVTKRQMRFVKAANPKV